MRKFMFPMVLLMAAAVDGGAPKATKTSKGGAAKPTVGTPEAAEAARAAKEEMASKDRFIYVGEPTKKLPPQAQTIVNAIKAAGDKGLSRKELVDGLKGVLVTKQPKGRIVSYYQKAIQEVGAVKLTSGKVE